MRVPITVIVDGTALGGMLTDVSMYGARLEGFEDILPGLIVDVVMPRLGTAIGSTVIHANASMSGIQFDNAGLGALAAGWSMGFSPRLQRNA